METIFVLTHLVMITCAGIFAFSISPQTNEERAFKKEFSHKHLVTIFKADVKNKQMAKGLLKARHFMSLVHLFKFDLNNDNRILSTKIKSYGVEIERINQIETTQSVKMSLFENCNQLTPR